MEIFVIKIRYLFLWVCYVNITYTVEYYANKLYKDKILMYTGIL